MTWLLLLGMVAGALLLVLLIVGALFLEVLEGSDW